MIIKRLMALTALASTAALAQQQQPGDGNVPAPDLFDDQIVCTSNLPGAGALPTPTVAPKGATQSALDTAIGMGTSQITGSSILNDLGYVIPHQYSNCGMGVGANFTTAAQGSVATDVATGYTALMPKFTAVYGDPGVAASTGTAGAVARARDALARAEADDNTSQAVLDSLRRTLATAEERDNEARAAFDAIARGPIYQAAAAEWMAKAAVTRSIADYNEAVTDVVSAQSTLDTMSYAGYVPLGNSELVGTAVIISSGMGTVNLAQLNNYTNSDLNNPQVATVDEDGVTDTTDSNFDAAGNLVVPMRLVDGALKSVTRSTLVSVARSNRDRHRIALEALKKYKEENRNIALDRLLAEAVRRAQAESDYYETQFRNVLSDTTNQNPVTIDIPSTPRNEAAPYSISSRHVDWLAADGARLTAEAVLRDAAANREAATQNVIDAFQNPGSFYAQLLERRVALKAEADRRVAAVTNPSKALTDAAAAAAKALTEAEAALGDYAALVGDPEGPVVGLVDTLLETGGDDGQAVATAIARTWDGTVDNKDAIAGLTADTADGAEKDGPVTANRKAIDALTADTDDGAEADGPVTANRKAIDALKGDNGASAGIVAANTENIATNAAAIVDNAGHIATNAGNIAANAGHIASNAGNISVNASNIVDNRGLIRRNAATLVEHGAFIERNAGHIARNGERIGANAAAIGMNSGLIADNRHLIGELSGELDIVRAGVAASIALSRMPSVDGGGVSFGAGTFAGEMAYAVGFQVERGFGTFDVGLTSSGGEIGAGVGVGLKVWH